MTEATHADQLRTLNSRIDDLSESNTKLTATLREAREQIIGLKEEVDRLSAPPNGYAIYLGPAADDLVDVTINGRKMRVAMAPEVDRETLRPGQEVILNESMNVVVAGNFDDQGEIVVFQEVLEDGMRAIVTGRSDEERVIHLAAPLRDVPLRSGDSLLADMKAGYAFERIAKSEVEDLVLEEVPDINYEDIGGLRDQINTIRDAVELPFLHPELFKEYEIKGPELLNKFVGETERQIRIIFQRAREKASEGTPVIVFFDEMDSLFRTRGSGVSSDVENTIVPQLLSEIDGVESLENVIVIGASNREDMIDPAILRPGRLDVKIKIERPDAQAAIDIFGKYLTTDLPLSQVDLAEHGNDAHATTTAMIQRVVEEMYSTTPNNEFLEVTYANGDKEVLYFKDFSSGAMIENIVSRAKKAAIKSFLTVGEKGITIEHLLQACLDEFHENEDLPNTTNPDDWSRISGKKGDRIVFMRTLIHGKKGDDSGRSIDTSLSPNPFA